jgi:hypothetical protein
LRTALFIAGQKISEWHKADMPPSSMVAIGGKADIDRTLRNASRLATAIPATIQREKVARAAAEAARKPANKQTSKQANKEGV